MTAKNQVEIQRDNYKAALEDIAAVLRQDPSWSMDTLAEIQLILKREGFEVGEAEGEQ